MENLGLIIEPPKESDYVFGGDTFVVDDILQKGGHGWGSYLPTVENQSGKKLSSQACVTYSCLNCHETYAKRKHCFTWNKSDRALAKMSGTTKKGNSLRTVAETLRKQGWLDEAEWTANLDLVDWNTYYTPIPSNLLSKASEVLNTYQFSYEWGAVTKNGLISALERSPLQVTVNSGGKKDSKGYFIKDTNNYNHAIMLYEYKFGEYWECFDSLRNTMGRYVWNYRFGSVMKHQSQKRVPVIPNKISFKKGLTDMQKESITMLVDSGKPFSPTDAKNYAYATGQSDWLQFVGKKGSEII